MVQQIPYEGNRVETGAVQFGDDWPGLFIRGDNAMALQMAIAVVLLMLDEDKMHASEKMSADNLRRVADLISRDVIATN